MSDANLEATERPEPLSDEQLDAVLEVIDSRLDAFCNALSGGGADSPEQLVAVMAYALTAIFATRPDLYEDFVQLLAAFQPRYEALMAIFASTFPEAHGTRAEGEVFFLSPSLATDLPEEKLN